MCEACAVKQENEQIYFIEIFNDDTKIVLMNIELKKKSN